MMFKVKIDSDTERPDLILLRAWLSDIFWNLAYHERELRIAATERVAGQMLLSRCGCTFTAKEAGDFYDDVETRADEQFDDPEDVIKYTIGRLLNSADYHEEQLVAANQDLTAAKELLKRGSYDLNLNELRREQEKKAEKKAAR